MGLSGLVIWLYPECFTKRTLGICQPKQLKQQNVALAKTRLRSFGMLRRDSGKHLRRRFKVFQLRKRFAGQKADVAVGRLLFQKRCELVQCLLGSTFVDLLSGISKNGLGQPRSSPPDEQKTRDSQRQSDYDQRSGSS
jgi:hypothetical protein